MSSTNLKQSDPFKIGLNRQRTLKDGWRFASFYFLKSTGGLWAFLFLLSALTSAKNHRPVFDFQFFIGFPIVCILIALAFAPRAISMARKYPYYWFIFSDKSIRVYSDDVCAQLWLEIPYEDVVSLHHVQYYLWEDRLLAHREPIGYELTFIRHKWNRFKSMGIEIALDTGPKSQKDLAAFIAEFQKRCPSAGIFNTVDSIRGVLFTR